MNVIYNISYTCYIHIRYILHNIHTMTYNIPNI